MVTQVGRKMDTLVIVGGSVLLLGGGCGYYGYTRYRRTGIGSALGSAALILVAVWLFGGLHFYGP
jgi:hypothetical protein